jgi:hypothetical protein
MFAIDPLVAASKAEKASFVALADAKSLQELEATVSYLGVVLHVRNGEWIAIRYRDRHRLPSWSVAVALDSQGHWFVSRRHFCGRLSGYAWLRRVGQDLEGFEDLVAIEQAADLAEAWPLLMGLEFHPADCTLTPGMTGPLKPGEKSRPPAAHLSDRRHQSVRARQASQLFPSVRHGRSL